MSPAVWSDWLADRSCEGGVVQCHAVHLTLATPQTSLREKQNQVSGLELIDGLRLIEEKDLVLMGFYFPIY